MTIRDIRPVEDLPLLDTGLEMCEAEDEKSHKGVYKHLKKDGTLIRVDIQTNRIRFRGRNAKLVLAMDVTERLNYIKAVEKQNALLREISWIQSHKVRAPLARIMGLVPMLRDCGNLSAEDLEVMSYLLTSVGELDQTIREITDKTVLERYNDPLVGLTYSNLNHR